MLPKLNLHTTITWHEAVRDAAVAMSHTLLSLFAWLPEGLMRRGAEPTNQLQS
jgi:hypothetical protein